MDSNEVKPLEDSDDKKDVTLLPVTTSSEQNLAEVKPEVQYFQCSNCKLKEKFDYFGMNPPYTSDFLLLEDCYVIEDPFLPPKRGEFIILGSNCTSCKKPVCKDSECSVYYGGTYCVKCAGNYSSQFPQPVREKVSRLKDHSI